MIGYWYFERVLSPPTGADLFGPRTAAFAVNLIIFAAVIVVLVQVALLEWSQRHRRRTFDADTVLELMATGPLGPMHIAQLLLFALTLGGITVYASRILYYRRGY